MRRTRESINTLPTTRIDNFSRIRRWRRRRRKKITEDVRIIKSVNERKGTRKADKRKYKQLTQNTKDKEEGEGEREKRKEDVGIIKSVTDEVVCLR